MEHEDDELLSPKPEGGVLNGRTQKKIIKKKEKPVKIQQRGLGVAELEKRRLLEEQQQQHNTNNNNGAVVISSSPVNRSVSAPLQPPFFTNSDHQTLHPLYPHLNVGHQRAVQFTGSSELFETQGIGSSNHSSSESAMSCLYKANTSNQARTNLPVQLGNQHSYFYAPSTVNHLAANSSMAVKNLQSELPSNQSLRGTCRSVQPDDEEMNVGSKRQHLLSPHDLPDAVGHCKYNPLLARHGLERTTSLRAPQGQGSFAINGNPTLRGLQSSLSMPNLKLRKDTNTGTGMPLLSGLEPKQGTGVPNPDTTIYQVYSKESNSQQGGSTNMFTNHQQLQVPDPTFLTSSNNERNGGQSAVESNHSTNGDAEEKLDLSLRL